MSEFDTNTIKMLLDTLTGTLTDLSTNINSIAESQKRSEGHVAALESNVNSAISTSRDNAQKLSDVKNELTGIANGQKDIKREIEGDGHGDIGLIGSVQRIKETALADMEAIRKQMEGDGKNDQGLRADVKAIKEGMGWVGKWGEMLRQPMAILLIVAAIVGTILGAKQGWDSVKGLIFPQAQNQPVDTAPPTIPQGLTVIASTDTITLTWMPSSDTGTGVVWYRVMRDGSLVGISESNVYIDGGLKSSERHCYAIQSVDAVGNISPSTAAKCATTK